VAQGNFVTLMEALPPVPRPRRPVRGTAAGG